MALLTLAQSGLPGCVRVRRPVMESFFSFLARRSRAICRPMAFISFLLRAEVMYMCISKKRPENIKTCMIEPSVPTASPSFSSSLLPSGSSSAWSSSSLVKRLTNHSKDFWSRLIQMKSTCRNEWMNDAFIWIRKLDDNYKPHEIEVIHVHKRWSYLY